MAQEHDGQVIVWWEIEREAWDPENMVRKRSAQYYWNIPVQEAYPELPSWGTPLVNTWMLHKNGRAEGRIPGYEEGLKILDRPGCFTSEKEAVVALRECLQRAVQRAEERLVDCSNRVAVLAQQYPD